MTSRVSLNGAGVEGDQASHSSSLSADGRYVAFQSRAFNFVSEHTEGWRDIFVKDRATAAGGEWTAAIAKDGLFDSLREDFALVIGPLTSGKHTIEVSVFNAAGTRAVEKREVTIP